MIGKKRELDGIIRLVIQQLKYMNSAYTIVNTILTKEFKNLIINSFGVFEPLVQCMREIEIWRGGLSRFVREELDEKKWILRPKNRILKLFLACRVNNDRARTRESVNHFRHLCSNKLEEFCLPNTLYDKVKKVCEFFEEGDRTSFFDSEVPVIFSHFHSHGVSNLLNDLKDVLSGSCEDFGMKEISQIRNKFNGMRKKIVKFNSKVENVFNHLTDSSTLEFIRYLRLLGEYNTRETKYGYPRKRTDSKKKKKMKRSGNIKSIIMYNKNEKIFYDRLYEIRNFMKVTAPNRMKKIRKEVPKYVKPLKGQTKKCNRVFRRKSKYLEDRIIKNFKALKSIDDQKVSYFDDMLLLSDQIRIMLHSKKKIIKGARKVEKCLSSITSSLCLFENVLKMKKQVKEKLEDLKTENEKLEMIIHEKFV